MRVLVISDTHGTFDVKSYEALQRLEFDACVSLGDVDKATLRWWENQCQDRGVPMYAVVGNHDTWQWLDEFTYLQNVHGRYFLLGEYRCLGFGGAFDYEDTSDEDRRVIPVMGDEESLVMEDARTVDVLFSHDSAKVESIVEPELLARVVAQIPHAVNHPGLLGITRYVEKNAPRYAISGHHHAKLCVQRGRTTFIATYGLEIIDLDAGSVESVL